MLRLAIFILIGLLGAAVSAQQLLPVAEPVWAALSQAEKDDIQKRFLVQVAGVESFGVVLDNQGVNESSPGSNAGSNLGQAVASASYIDRSLNAGNYSAKNHLGVMLLGGLLGSSLDAKPVSQFHFRYAVKFLNGNIQYFDVLSSEAFRHPAGVCVLTPAVTIAPEQHLCSQTVETFRSTYLQAAAVAYPVSVAPSPVQLLHASPQAVSATPISSSQESISCKLNALAPVRTTVEKCKLINGRRVND